jgi:hypothetical protein
MCFYFDKVSKKIHISFHDNFRIFEEMAPLSTLLNHSVIFLSLFGDIEKKAAIIVGKIHLC